ncbi:MAG: PAS domain-containing protein [Hyphomicrobiales bacterium]
MQGPTPQAFRAQLVIPEQRQLFDYWLSKRQSSAPPRRTDINPSHFPRLLPFVSLIDCEKTGRYRVRLAGTRLREVYDCEITGQFIDDFNFGDLCEYWLTAYQQVSETAAPAQGVVRGPKKTKEHLVQFWLRLPLADDCGTISMILAHDSFVPAMEMPDHDALHA